DRTCVRGGSGAGDFARLDAGRAHVHPLAGAVVQARMHRLDVRVPTAFGPPVRVRDGHSEAGSLGTDVADGSHSRRTPRIVWMDIGKSSLPPNDPCRKALPAGRVVAVCADDARGWALQEACRSMRGRPRRAGNPVRIAPTARGRQTGATSAAPGSPVHFGPGSCGYVRHVEECAARRARTGARKGDAVE